MRSRSTTVFVVVAATAVASLGCFDGLFGGEGGVLGDILNPAPPPTPVAKPLCEGFTLPGNTFGSLERVVLDVRLREDLREFMPPIAAKVQYEGSDKVVWATMMLTGEEGQERYMMVLPPSARLWEPSRATITLEVLVEGQGGAVSTCTGDGMITIEGLREAPGTLAALVPRSRRLIELQAGRLGLTLEDLRGDPSGLPAVAAPLVMALYMLEGEGHPNALAKIAAGRARDQAELGKGLKLAEALLAAAKHPQELEATIAIYEALPPAEPLTLEPAQPRSWRPGGLEWPCDVARQLDIRTPEVLSNYMREGQRHRQWGKELNNPYDFKGAGYAVITGIGQVPLVGDAVTELPGVGLALNIAGTAITVDILYKQFLADIYPSKLVSPSVEVTREEFEEDSPEVGLWLNYEVSAQSVGADTTKLNEAIVSAVAEAIISIIPVGKKIFEKEVDGVTKYLIKSDETGKLVEITLKEANILKNKEYVRSKVRDRMGKEFDDRTVKPQLERFKCTVPPRVWGRFNLSPNRFRTVEYGKPLERAGQEDLPALADLAPEGFDTGALALQGFRLKALAGGGTGQIVLRPVIASFPPASNVASGGITKNIEVPSITVTLEPAVKRVALGGEEVIVAKVEHALNRDVELKVYAGNATCGPATPARDAAGNMRFLCKFGSDPDADFPVRVAARSLARGGAVNPDAAAVGYGTYIAGPQLELDPVSACVAKGARKKFTARADGAQDPRVTWKSSGGKISASGEFSSDKPGSYLITATLVENPKVQATASVTVGQCKCPWSARIMGPLPYSAGGFTDISALWEPSMQNLQITATDKRGLRFVVIAPGVPWGVAGVYGARGTAAPPGSAGLVDSFDAPALRKDGSLSRSELAIDLWDGHKIKGRYQGESVFFATQFGDAPLSAAIELQFDMIVSTTDVLDVLTHSCIEED
jgi:hypothetical protein